MSDQIYFEDVTEGASIGELRKKPSTMQLVHWAAASGDFDRIHYDKDYAVERGLGGVIVHGALKHAFLGELIYRWMGPLGRIKRLRCSYRGMDVPGKDFIIKGKVISKHTEGEENLVELEVWGESENGQVTTPGKAVVLLPLRG